MQTLSVLSWFVPGVALLLAGCAPKREGLTAYIPNGAVAVAYVDLDRARTMPIYERLPVPDDLKDASAVLAVFDGKDWGTAVQRKSGITATGIAAKQNGGKDLLAHAPAEAPAWLVTRGSVTLPLPGNLVNINRLLHQSEYTAVSAQDSDIVATAECRTSEAARHLEENIRALASLARFQGIDVTSDGVTVRVRAKIPATAKFP
jgi:hypothetical protein